MSDDKLHEKTLIERLIEARRDDIRREWGEGKGTKNYIFLFDLQDEWAREIAKLKFGVNDLPYSGCHVVGCARDAAQKMYELYGSGAGHQMIVPVLPTIITVVVVANGCFTRADVDSAFEQQPIIITLHDAQRAGLAQMSDLQIKDACRDTELKIDSVIMVLDLSDKTAKNYAVKLLGRDYVLKHRDLCGDGPVTPIVKVEDYRQGKARELDKKWLTDVIMRKRLTSPPLNYVPVSVWSAGGVSVFYYSLDSLSA